VDASNELVIPDTYRSAGILNKDSAMTTTPSTTVVEHSGYGYAQTLRRDVTGRSTTVAFTMEESHRLAFEVYYGVDLSSVQATPTGGKNEIVFDEPDRPASQYWRALAIGVDGDGTDSIYIADHYPRCVVTEVGAISASETELRRYAITLGADVDSTVGTAHRQLWAGPGLTDSVIAAMNFVRA
jgi:hypothetical protein